jgi:hypothetical protein
MDNVLSGAGRGGRMDPVIPGPGRGVRIDNLVPGAGRGGGGERLMMDNLLPGLPNDPYNLQSLAQQHNQQMGRGQQQLQGRGQGQQQMGRGQQQQQMPSRGHQYGSRGISQPRGQHSSVYSSSSGQPHPRSSQQTRTVPTWTGADEISSTCTQSRFCRSISWTRRRRPQSYALPSLLPSKAGQIPSGPTWGATWQTWRTSRRIPTRFITSTS